MNSRFNRKRPQKKETKREKKKPTLKNPKKIYQHPEFGDIPLIQETYTASNGKEYFYYVFDPEYMPPLPKGAVRANITQQIYSAYSVPYFYYIDIEKTCIQCDEAFTFSAKEQKYWYEVLKFDHCSNAIRCLHCRKKKRSDKFIQAQLMKASERLIEDSENPLSLISFAEAMIQHYERFQEGNLDKAIGSCRKALKIDPSLCEALYVEARCQELAKRNGRATLCYKNFFESAPRIKRYKKLIVKVKKILSIS